MDNPPPSPFAKGELGEIMIAALASVDGDERWNLLKV